MIFWHLNVYTTNHLKIKGFLNCQWCMWRMMNTPIQTKFLLIDRCVNEYESSFGCIGIQMLMYGCVGMCEFHFLEITIQNRILFNNYQPVIKPIKFHFIKLKFGFSVFYSLLNTVFVVFISVCISLSKHQHV